MTTREPTTWVGRPIRRRSDPALLTGRGRFVADLASRASVGFVQFVRSQAAAGRVEELEVPLGVTAFTADDLPSLTDIAPRLDRDDCVNVTTPVLARDRVRFVGEPVAAVVAATAAAAEDELERVHLTVDPLPAVTSVDGALADDAPAVHDVEWPGDRNVVVDATLGTDGVDDALAAADHVVAIEVSGSRQSAMPIEARASLVEHERDDRVTLTTTTQMPHVVRTGITDCLGIPEDRLRVVAPDVGGAFGAKMALAREDIVLVKLALELQRDLAWVEGRDDNLRSSWHSREQRYTARAGFTDDGQLTVLDVDMVADVGAYSCHPVTWGVEPLMPMAELPGPYAFEEYRAHCRGVTTNKCPIAPYRGVSRPMQTLVVEHLMDVAARQLDLGAAEIRRRNLISTYPYTSPSGLTIDASSHQETLQDALEAVEARPRSEPTARFLTGTGISCFAERTGYGTPAFAVRSMAITPGYERVAMSMDPSGGVIVRIGASPHGQGLATTLSQVVADQLGLAPEAVRVVASDTDATPYGWGSFSSRSMVISGGATLLAARDLAQVLRRAAADQLECDPDDVLLSDGHARITGTSRGVSIASLARRFHHQSHLVVDDQTLDVVGSYDPAGTFANACHMAEVEVDPATGHVRVTRFVVAEDAGVLVNPAIVDGQIHGGVVQGIGNALHEELLYDDAGNPLTTSLLDYAVPTVAEVPEIEVVHRETISPQTITGAKGVGEGGTIGAPAAVLNAINDALAPLGAEVTHIPATPARVRAAIRTAHDKGTTT